ncbi:hypothetical protein BH09SUM1_BH09SUM1_19070 [soil metagenome]
MARLGIFSDPHGNAAGMRAMLDHARQNGCTTFICLGDVAEGGEEGDACVRLLQEARIETIRGNHDEDCRFTPISDSSKSWLGGLPAEIQRGDTLFTHIAPSSEKPINSGYRAMSVFEEFADFRLLFVGHLHYPALFGERSEDRIQASLPKWSYGVPFALNQDDRYIICPGSVGYPRDGMRQLRYAILDEEANAVTFMRLHGPLLDFGN